MKSLYQNSWLKFIKFLLASYIIIALSTNATAQYCSAWGTYEDESIDSVKFGSIVNSSGWSGYADFTHLSTDVLPGQNYPMEVLNPSSYSSDYCDVWIDWNQDLDFNDSYEYYYLNTNMTPYYGIISTPSTALTGKTRMRIRIRYNGIVDPCGDANQNWGEVEDYSIRVVPSYNMSYTSSTCIQIDDPVFRGTVDQEILKIIVITDGGANPIDVSDFQCYTTGTTDPADILSAKMYYTGNSGSFSTNNQFGSASNNPNGYFTFMGTQSLVYDTNYFWLTYDIDPNATIGNYLDAVVTWLTVNGNPESPSIQDPPGEREIIGSGKLTVLPDSVSVTINACGDSTQQYIVVKNTGNANLNWACNLINLNNNKALHFDGVDDYIDVVSSSAPIGTSPYTIEVWTYYQTTAYNVIVGWGDHNSYFDEVNILAMDDNWIYNYWYDNYFEAWTDGLMNKWHHIAVTYDGINRKAYRNGVLVGSSYGNTLDVPYNDNFMIGDDGYNDYYLGYMDELRIWDRALTPEEIWNSMHFSNPLNTSGLVNQWSFNEGTGATTVDQSVNGDVGNIHGAVWVDINPYSFFLSGNINSGVLSPGDSAIVILNFYAGTLNSGVYYDSIIFVSDDPTLPLSCIPCTMIVNGFSRISILDTCINYPPVMTGATIYDTLWIYNLGCDTLIIDTLYTITGDFNTNITTLEIPPSDSGSIIVGCTPSSLGMVYDTLFIINNDKDTTICLSGSGTEAPVISTLPSQLDVIFTVCDDSTCMDIKIFNDGLYNLYLNIPDPGDISLLKPPPCIPQTVNYCCGMGIYNVKLNTINNTSGDGSQGYEDFTNTISTNLLPGKSYTIEVQTGPSYNENAAAWIDFDNSGSFETNERIMASGSKKNHSATFTVPANVMVNYPLRLRVGSDYFSQPIPGPCSNVAYGQFEDYTIIITSEWLSVGLLTDTLAPGDTTQTTVCFNANGMKAGMYNSLFQILSNDPVNPSYSVPCNLTISGTSSLEISSNVISFDSTMIGGSLKDSIFLINNSCDTLFVNAISDTNEFQIISYPSYVLAYDTLPLVISFNPLSYGMHYDTVQISTNDIDTTIYLEGFGLPAPLVVVEPDTVFTVIQECNDSLIFPVKIKNTGTLNLEWESNLKDVGTSYALDFEGNNGNVHIGNMGPRPEKGTIQFWMKTDVIVSYPNVFSTNGLSSNNQGIRFELNSSGRLACVFGNDAGSYRLFTLTNSLVANQWYFVTVMWDASINRVWGLIDDYMSVNYLYNDRWCTNFTDVRIGAGYNTSRYWNGQVDEVRMWDRILTTSEISENMYRTLKGDEQGLMAYWNFEKGSGTIAYDISDNGFDGTILGGVNWISSDIGIMLPWLTADTTYGTVSPGDSTMVNLKFNSLGMLSGTYSNSFTVYSNDPAKPEYMVPCFMEVIGSPELIFSDSTILFDTTLIGGTRIDTLLITNTGCDTLVIDSIKNIFPEINFTLKSDTILPGNNTELIFNFSPVSVVSFVDTILIYNNYIDTIFLVSAVSKLAPSFSFSPDSFNIIMQGCNDTLSTSLNLYNTGGSILNYNIELENIFYDDFENGLGNWTWNGYWGTESYMGSQVLTESPGTLYGDNWYYQVELREPLLVVDKDSFELSFMFETKLECWDDYLVLQYNINGGNYLNYEWYYCGETWDKLVYDMSNNVSNGDLVKFRFSFNSNEIYVDEGVRIDDFMVKGVTSANPWISFNPKNGNININDSTQIDIEFTTTGIFSGIYKTNLNISTNDPLHPNTLIPVQMTFNGDPYMVLSEYCLAFDSIMVGAVITDTIFVNNTGCDTLFINNITNNLPDFYLDKTSFNVPPGVSTPLLVYFSPTSATNLFDTLHISTNTNDTVVCLSGTGLPSPSLVYDPAGFNIVFPLCDDSATQALTIKNTGQADLNWQLSLFDPDNYSLWFDGINDYVELGYWTAGNTWTLEAWVKPDAIPSGRKNIVGALNSCLDWAICMQSGVFGVSTKPANGACSMTLLSDITAVPGQWYHVAGTYNGNKAYIYVNGSLRDSSDVYNYSGTTNSVRIGGETCCSGNYFPGEIDEVRIWNVVRTGQQINDYMNSPVNNRDPNLLGYYTMNQGSGSTNLTDDSQYGHTGTIYYSQWRTSEAPVSKFLSVDSWGGTLGINDSIIISVDFNALGMISGNYYNELHLSTNDPLNYNVIIPCSMEVIGEPVIYLSDTCLDMDSVMVGAISYDTLFIINEGCKTLIIDSITNNYPEYQIMTPTSGIGIPPYDSITLIISFNPSSLITYYDTLKIYNDDHFESICLSGTGIVFPVISIQPNTFSPVINVCDDSTTMNLRIYNTGSADLYWKLVSSSVGIFEDFNQGINGQNWSNINGAISSSCGYYSAPNALYFNNYGTRQAVTRAINTYGGGTIEFYLKYGSGSSPCEKPDSGEEVELSYTIDGGYSWNVINIYPTNTYFNFTLISEPIPQGAISSSTYFRWRQLSNSGSGYDNWALDDIKITLINYTSFTIDTGMVAINDSVDIPLTFNAHGLTTGVYNSFISLVSNDPVNSLINIPYALTVNGYPVIELSDNCVAFPPTMIGDTYSDTVAIINSGCDELIISSLNNSTSAFNFSIAYQTIQPENSEDLIITFNPVTTGTFYDTIFIMNNDADTFICLSGQAIEAPIIGITPQSINTSILCFDTLHIPINITNSGPVNLTWQIELEENTDNMLVLDGVDDYVYLGYWSPGSSWTLEAWVRPSATPAGRKSIVGGLNSCNDWAIVMMDGFFGLSVKPDDGNCSHFITSGVEAIPGQWYHIAGVNDGYQARIYVNGVLRNTEKVSPGYAGTSSNPWIGGSACCGGEYFPGAVDEVRIWNKPRTDVEIYSFMSIYLNGDEQGLIGYYTMDEGNGTTIYDISPNNHNGTIHSSPVWAPSDTPVMNYISTDIDSGTVLPSDTTIIQLTLMRNILNSAVHSTKLIIHSNDPLNPSDTINVTLSYPNIIKLPDLGNDTIICLMDTILLSPGNFSTYLWSDGSTGQSLYAYTTSNYYVDVADAFGCIFSDTLNLTVNLPLPIVDAGGDRNICSGLSTSLDGSATGGSIPYSYTWSASDGSTIPDQSDPSVDPDITTHYSLYVIDYNGCKSSNTDTATVFVTQSPLIDAGNDTTISLGSIITMNASVVSGIPPFSYLWTPQQGLNDFTILNPIASPLSSTVYNVQITDSTGCSGNDNVTITIKYSLSGDIIYNNIALSPLNSTWVNLYDVINNIIVDSVYTNSSGTYIFNNLDNGNYKVYAKTEKAWGGVNATDALVIRRHIVGFEPLLGLPLVAADVNNTSSVTSADALHILRRTIGLSSSFELGDWVFDTISLFINNSNKVIDIIGLCVGDVNQSYNPSTKKSSPSSIGIVREGIMYSEIGNEILLPVYLDRQEKIGAITLDLFYNAEVTEVIDIITELPELKYNITNEKVSIGWSNTEPYISTSVDPMLFIKIRPKLASYKAVDFSVGNISEIADEKAKILEGLSLKIPDVRNPGDNIVFSLGENYPNPFNNTTEIPYSIPESGRTRLIIFNLLGEKVKVILDQLQVKGNYKVEFNRNELAEGIYLYKLEFEGRENYYESTRRMIINQ